MDQDTAKTFLENGALEMGLNLQPLQVERLLEYLSLFSKWNKAYNLSAIRDTESMVSLHLLDSLSIYPYLKGQRLIDVGTGGGLPGIPMAVMFPERSFTLLDSAGKKTRFLFQVTQSLGLDNVEVENCRVESFQPDALFDGVISRAFASLADMTGYCRHLLNENGRFWAMKGQFPTEELEYIAGDYTLEHQYPLKIAGLNAERCLLVLKPRD